jgi:hypothetical protein
MLAVSMRRGRHTGNIKAFFNAFDKVFGPAFAEYIITKILEYDEAEWG